jgi:hypothetical protein
VKVAEPARIVATGPEVIDVRADGSSGRWSIRIDSELLRREGCRQPADGSPDIDR